MSAVKEKCCLILSPPPLLLRGRGEGVDEFSGVDVLVRDRVCKPGGAVALLVRDGVVVNNCGRNGIFQVQLHL